jgi:TIR domain
MARLFISHSSRNNDKAIEVRDWLAANGWDDVFLDLDPERGIVAGQRWKEALQQAASRCEVVLALVSAEWLASSYCKAEINTAQMMGKKTIIALIDKRQVPGDLTDEQFIDLSGDPQAYRRLKKGLELAGLDPLSFPFEPGRRPYPGFAYFEEQDVAVFSDETRRSCAGSTSSAGWCAPGSAACWLSWARRAPASRPFCEPDCGRASSATIGHGCRCRSSGLSAR